MRRRGRRTQEQDEEEEGTGRGRLGRLRRAGAVRRTRSRDGARREEGKRGIRGGCPRWHRRGGDLFGRRSVSEVGDRPRSFTGSRVSGRGQRRSHHGAPPVRPDGAQPAGRLFAAALLGTQGLQLQGAARRPAGAAGRPGRRAHWHGLVSHAHAHPGRSARPDHRRLLPGRGGPLHAGPHHRGQRALGPVCHGRHALRQHAHGAQHLPRDDARRARRTGGGALG